MTGANRAGHKDADRQLNEEHEFDPRVPTRRPWRETAAALASCAVVLAGGYAVGLTDGPDTARAAAKAPEEIVTIPSAVAPRIQVSEADVHAMAPATLVAPAGAGAEAEPAGPVDYYRALSGQGLDRVAGLDIQQVTVGSGDTLGRILTRAGVDTQQSAEAIGALKDVWDPRSLRVGQDVTIYLHTSALRRVATRPEAPNLVGLSLKPDVDRTVAVALDEAGVFQAGEMMTELSRQLVRVNGDIDAALYIDAAEQGATDRIIANYAQLFSFSVDIQREIQPGDDFEILYEEFRGPNGELVKTGDILYAALETDGKLKQLYRFESTDGVDYFDPEGVSIRRFLMKTPINGARLSSRFGPRHHPIQGYTKMHKGTDFAAPRGTPIYAAGDGVIEKQYRSSSYGNYIRIRHNGAWKTAYAHMQRFAGGMREGVRVRQGEIIGYVGSTGNSTGPHLHYEVLQNGTQVDSMSVQVPTGKELEGDEKQRFMAAMGGIAGQYAEAPGALDAERVAVASAGRTGG